MLLKVKVKKECLKIFTLHYKKKQQETETSQEINTNLPLVYDVISDIIRRSNTVPHA